MKTSAFRFVVVFLSLWQSLLLAVELKVWTPKANGPKLILPVPDGGDAEAAAAAYLERLYAAKDLHSAMESEWITKAQGKFADLPDSGGPLFALLDNSFETRLDEVRAFERAGANTFLVPLGAELALSSQKDRAEFRRVLADRADAMVAIGGADIAPEVYGEAVTHAVKTNVRRDRMELQLLKTFLDRTDKPLFGICRGHQIIGVLHGYKLIQDLAIELGATGHENGHHDIEIAEGSVLAGFLGGNLIVRVNSYHHQAVKMKSRGRLVATAYEGDGATKVVEAMESRDGRVVTVQFHPEVMKSSVGRSIMEGFVQRVQ